MLKTPPRTTLSAGEPSLRDSLVVLAHELRNPLMLIRTEIALLRRENGDRSNVLETCSIVDQQLTQLGALIEDVVGLASLDNGDQNGTVRRLDLRDVVRCTVSGITALVETQNLSLAVDTGTEALTVCGNAVRLSQALVNILTNAAKFTDPGGTIIVLAAREEEWVRVSVRDTGRGMPGDFPPPAADPTVRAAVGAQGSGIGLAVAQYVIAAHGGSLHGKSAGLGLGSEFVIRLPAASST